MLTICLSIQETRKLKAVNQSAVSVQWNTNCKKATNKTADILNQVFLCCMFRNRHVHVQQVWSSKKKWVKREEEDFEMVRGEVTWPRLRTYEDSSDDNEFLSSVISSRWQRLAAWTQVLPIIGPHRYASFPYEEDEGKEASWSEDVKPKTCSNYYAKFSIVLNGVDTIRTRDTHTNLEGQEQ